MKVLKKEIINAVNIKKDEIKMFIDSGKESPYGYKPCVYVSKISARKYYVGFAFCDNNRKEGDEYICSDNDTRGVIYYAK